MSNEITLFQFHNCIEDNIKTIIKEAGIPNTVVELGIFQGYFTLNMTGMIAPNNPGYKHYAIDPFSSSHDLAQSDIDNAHSVFKNNLEQFPYKNNIEFMRTTSWKGLFELLKNNVQADLVYIDGDHRASYVLDDLVLSYKLVKVGGVILCDDSVSWVHTDKNREKQLQMSPRLAVDNFIQCYWDRIEILNLPNNWQTAFIKRAD